MHLFLCRLFIVFEDGGCDGHLVGEEEKKQIRRAQLKSAWPIATRTYIALASFKHERRRGEKEKLFAQHIKTEATAAAVLARRTKVFFLLLVCYIHLYIVVVCRPTAVSDIQL